MRGRFVNDGVGIVLAVLAAGTCLAACDWMVPIVTSHYDTVAEARDGHLFGKGWLPDILPGSTTHIRTSNNLDISTSEGGFRMPLEDLEKFTSRLEAGAPASAPFGRWKDELADRREDGETVWTFRDEDSTWVFFCREESGRCDYVMWLRR